MHHRPGEQANLLGALALAVVDRLSEALLQGGSRSLSGAAALVHIQRRPGRTIDFLARVLGLTQSAAVRLIDRLQREELVERRPGADGRSLALFLSPTGQQRAADTMSERAQVLDGVLGPLSARERQQLATLLEKLLAGLTDDRWSARHTCRLCDIPACTHPGCPIGHAATHEQSGEVPLINEER
jgi:MarR family transcriptional repressor of emrRAB